MKFFNISNKTKNILKKVGAIVLAAALAIGGITLVTSLVERSKEDFKETRLSYDIGGITADGSYDKDAKNAIYTNKAIECTGIHLEADFDSDITFEVHFYDEEGKWLSMQQNDGLKLLVDEMPEGAVAVRVVIRPADDDEVGIIEKYTYANQLTVKIRTEEVKTEAEA